MTTGDLASPVWILLTRLGPTNPTDVRLPKKITPASSASPSSSHLFPRLRPSSLALLRRASLSFPKSFLKSNFSPLLCQSVSTRPLLQDIKTTPLTFSTAAPSPLFRPEFLNGTAFVDSGCGRRSRLFPINHFSISHDERFLDGSKQQRRCLPAGSEDIARLSRARIGFSTKFQAFACV